MSGFSTQVIIAASVDKVWELHSDFGNVYEWNHLVQKSYLTSDISEGVGTSRHCDLEDGNYIDEQVTEWIPSRMLTVRVTGTSMPLQRSNGRITLREVEEGTVVEFTVDYAIKFGLFGRLQNALFVERSYKNKMDEVLNALKERVAAKQPQQ